jgi:glycosyltransferase involved in cell wall biosynthesis
VAFALLSVHYPNIQLRIAGGYRKKGIRKSGYERWLEKKITQLGIIESVKWLGNLNAEEIVAELQSANCTIISSFVESYCMALAEAITVGCPCVVSYAGAMPELAQDNVSALFFPMGDYTMCASKIGQILSDEILAQSLSFNAIQKSKHDKHPDAIMSEQVELYNKLLQ